MSKKKNQNKLYRSSFYSITFVSFRNKNLFFWSNDILFFEKSNKKICLRFNILYETKYITYYSKSLFIKIKHLKYYLR